MKNRICTTIEQSKELAEILPLKSADMSYTLNFDSEKYEISTTPYKGWIVPKYAESYKGLNQVLPCWSLAALIELLPSVYTLKPMIDLEENSIYYSGHNTLYTNGDTLIDACINMIFKLNEQNLI